MIKKNIYILCNLMHFLFIYFSLVNVRIYPNDYSVEEEVYMANQRRRESIVAEVAQEYKKYSSIGNTYDSHLV